jgi:uncharacterized sulfatase
MNKTHYFLLLRRLALVWLLYGLCRVIFCLINWGQYGEAHIIELSRSFLKGSLFDLSAVLLINCWIILLSILPFEFVSRHSYQSVLSILFQVINIPFLILNVINAGYFRLAGKRITPAEGPELGTTTAEQVQLLVSEYWYVSLLALLVSLLLIWYSPSHYKLDKKQRYSSMWGWLGVFLSLAVCFLGFAFMSKSHPLSQERFPATRESHLENLSRNAAFNLVARFFDQAVKKID